MNEFEKQLEGQPLRPIPTEWRAQILKEAGRHKLSDVAESGARPLAWLREVLWPCPQAWGALAAVWIVIAVVKFTTPSAATSNVNTVAKNQVISVSEQRRELANLLDAAPDKSNRSPADRPRSARIVLRSFV